MEYWGLLCKLLISNTTYLSQQLVLKRNLLHWLGIPENEIEFQHIFHNKKCCTGHQMTLTKNGTDRGHQMTDRGHQMTLIKKCVGHGAPNELLNV